MIMPIVVDWVKKYLPILINSMCTALCVALAGCKLAATDLTLEIHSPLFYHSLTNSLPR